MDLAHGGTKGQGRVFKGEEGRHSDPSPDPGLDLGGWRDTSTAQETTYRIEHVDCMPSLKETSDHIRLVTASE